MRIHIHLERHAHRAQVVHARVRRHFRGVRGGHRRTLAPAAEPQARQHLQRRSRALRRSGASRRSAPSPRDDAATQSRTKGAAAVPSAGARRQASTRGSRAAPPRTRPARPRGPARTRRAGAGREAPRVRGSLLVRRRWRTWQRAACRRLRAPGRACSGRASGCVFTLQTARHAPCAARIVRRGAAWRRVLRSRAPLCAAV